MKGSVNLLKVRDIAIRVHWSFIFLVAWILILQAVNRAPVSQTLWALLSVFAIFSCVVLHELGHALTAARYGIATRNILLLPVGGVANIARTPDNPKQEIAISIAGPLVNLLIAGLLLPFTNDYTPFWKSTTVIYNVQPDNFVYYLHTVNIILALFNLIPAFPMDGGRVLRGCLALCMNYSRATTIAAITGRVIAGIFIVTGLLTFNPVLAIIGAFIILAGASEERMSYLRTHIKNIALKDMVMRDFASLPAGAPLNKAAELLQHRHDKYFVLTDNQVPVGIINRAAMIKAMLSGKYEAYLTQLKTAPAYAIAEESDTTAAVEKLIRHSATIFPVTNAGKLSRVINLNAVMEHVLIHDMNGKDIHKASALSWLSLASPW